VEGILVATAAPSQDIHFDSYWGLPGFQNDLDDEKSSSRRVNAEEPSYCGTVAVKHDAIVCTPDTMLARLAIHEAVVICLRFLERGNSMMTTVWTSAPQSRRYVHSPLAEFRL
jgi:hypothetical protein